MDYLVVFGTKVSTHICLGEIHFIEINNVKF